MNDTILDVNMNIDPMTAFTMMAQGATTVPDDQDFSIDPTDIVENGILR